MQFQGSKAGALYKKDFVSQIGANTCRMLELDTFGLKNVQFVKMIAVENSFNPTSQIVTIAVVLKYEQSDEKCSSNGINPVQLD